MLTGFSIASLLNEIPFPDCGIIKRGKDHDFIKKQSRKGNTNGLVIPDTSSCHMLYHCNKLPALESAGL